MTDHKWAKQFVESRGGALDEKQSSPAVRNLAECYLELRERQKIHAIDCDMDEDCSCEPEDPHTGLRVDPAKILKALSKDARRMLPKFPGIWDAAGLFDAISELLSEGLIEQVKLQLTGTYTYHYTDLGCECAAELDRQKKKLKR